MAIIRNENYMANIWNRLGNTRLKKLRRPPR